MGLRRWTVADIPDQAGKLVVVTGANSGLGFEVARALAGKGARLVMAVRDEARGQAAAEALRREHAGAEVTVMSLDLADLAAVRRFAEAFRARYEALPLLINNAGVMALPLRRTADGFEMQFGTNHLGHFALTGLLLPAILAAPRARVVVVSSGAHTGGAIDFDNLDGSKGYKPWGVYSTSKLANLLFAYELQRRFTTAGADAISVGCNPGWSATNLQAAGPRMEGAKLRVLLMEAANRTLAQSAAMGALPLLYAATAERVHGCDYISPMGLGGTRGYPCKLRSSPLSYDAALARRLWQVSEDLTGVRYDLPSPSGEAAADPADRR